MNPVQRLARQPLAYRLLLRSGALVEAVERILRWVTVTGRKTGIPRTCTLQAIPDGDIMLVVGSNWGRAEHPAWSANFLAADHVTVQRRTERSTAFPTSRVSTTSTRWPAGA